MTYRKNWNVRLRGWSITLLHLSFPILFFAGNADSPTREQPIYFASPQSFW